MCELPHLCGDLKPGEQCQACGDRGPDVQARFYPNTFTTTIVNYVVEARAGQRPWLIMTNAGEDEASALASFQAFGRSKKVQHTTTQYRLVKRTAVLTDEVLESDG